MVSEFSQPFHYLILLPTLVEHLLCAHKDTSSLFPTSSVDVGILISLLQARMYRLRE